MVSPFMGPPGTVGMDPVSCLVPQRGPSDKKNFTLRHKSSHSLVTSTAAVLGVTTTIVGCSIQRKRQGVNFELQLSR
jgi:hypothetical protein